MSELFNVTSIKKKKKQKNKSKKGLLMELQPCQLSFLSNLATSLFLAIFSILELILHCFKSRASNLLPLYRVTVLILIGLVKLIFDLFFLIRNKFVCQNNSKILFYCRLIIKIQLVLQESIFMTKSDPQPQHLSNIAQ